MKACCCLLFCLIVRFCPAQEDSSINRIDSLENITVTAFRSDANWRTVAAAVNTLSTAQLQSGNPVSLVSVMNTLPGVRMEERSPASYRLSLRGSLLRSPFGVRNIKIYWNDIPLTDGGGNTYLNLVALSQISALEVVKGPVASMYGAGTGGLLLLQSKVGFSTNKKETFKVSINGGSFGLLSQDAAWTKQRTNSTMQLLQSHQQGDGYRQQSAWRRDALQWNSAWKWQQQQLEVLSFYTNLYYQTPGGITYNQMMLNPKLARQPAGSLPGAVQQQTAIYNATIFAGITHKWQLSKLTNWQTTISGSNTAFKNPFITNYEKRKENNVSGRSVIHVQQHINQVQWQWTSGVEWLHNHSIINNFSNNSGIAGNMLFADDVFANQWFLFSQYKLQWKQFSATIGASVNQQQYRYQRTSDAVVLPFTTINGKKAVTPRLSLTGKLWKELQWYAVAAQGFSSPTLAEVRPSAGNFSNNLIAENGWNLEAGIKGYLFEKQLLLDIAVYRFSLKDAIVRRNDSNGAEYFINAGGTQQNGIETRLVYQQKQATKWKTKYWSSWSYQPYRFTNYIQGTNNYSGNALTGVPKQIVAAGVEFGYQQTYMHLFYNYTASIPLNDANTVVAEDYHLLQIKIGHHFKWKQCRIHTFIFADNLFNELYSLGNDINAAGNRFYNPAPTSNFTVGFTVAW
jgi:iron complex outermembrane receptor protein